MIRLALTSVIAVILSVSAVGAETLDRIRDSGTIKLGYREDAPPFSFKNNIGEPAGYTIALCRAVAGQIKSQLKLDALKVDYVPVTAENRFKDVADGKID
ncbi:MAG: transporter substrate-binding domain-containing protein, partial [Pseudomonadota bacterium]